MTKTWIETIFCCCSNTPKPTNKTITLGCFGIDGAGKTTFLRMLKGEDPRNVLTTNGFSVLEMEYDAVFHLRIYDVGGDRGIRDIWSNYYGEVYGIIFVVDYANDETFRESIEAMISVTKHPQCAKKPILLVINNKNNQEIDDVEFSNLATSDTQQQMVMVTHFNKYNGYLDNIKNPSMNVYQRARKDRNAFQDQFVAFIELIAEHYAYLTEGVRSAELALKIKQQADKDQRKLMLMREEHEARKADVAALEGRARRESEIEEPAPPIGGADNSKKLTSDSPAMSLASSTIPFDMAQGSPEVTPPPGQINFCRISQTSTKPASPEEISQNSADSKVATYFLPPKSPGRHTSRILRIQNALSNRVAPI